jgi:Flp pilus assembly protein TadB
MIGQAMLLGAGAGLGAALLAWWLWPPRPSLGQALDALRRPPNAGPSRQQRREWLLGAPLARLGLPGAAIRADLALLERPVEGFRAMQVAATGVGTLAAVAVATLWGSAGSVPVLLAVLGAVAGWKWAAGRVQQAARQRRAELQHALSVVQDLIAVGMAGGAGIDQATDDAAAVCTGWAADRLRRTLHHARLARIPTWQALSTLSEQTRVGELTELANAIHLAGTEGARVRTALAAHSAAMRTRQIADMETAARSAAVRTSMPVLILALGYGIWLLYPALSALSAGL